MSCNLDKSTVWWKYFCIMLNTKWAYMPLIIMNYLWDSIPNCELLSDEYADHMSEHTNYNVARPYAFWKWNTLKQPKYNLLHIGLPESIPSAPLSQQKDFVYMFLNMFFKCFVVVQKSQSKKAFAQTYPYLRQMLQLETLTYLQEMRQDRIWIQSGINNGNRLVNFLYMSRHTATSFMIHSNKHELLFHGGNIVSCQYNIQLEMKIIPKWIKLTKILHFMATKCFRIGTKHTNCLFWKVNTYILPLTECDLVMPYDSIGSGNVLLPNDFKPWPDSILTYFQWGWVTITLG